MKKFEFNPGQSFVGILAAVVLGILLAFYSLILLWPQGNPYDSVKVTIPKGASLKEVSTTLQDYNIIRNENIRWLRNQSLRKPPFLEYNRKTQ